MAFVLDGNDNETYSFNPNLHRGGSGKFYFFHSSHRIYLQLTTIRAPTDVILFSLFIPSQYLGR
jgi:hypothetical protein